jgi:hypothetical protein
MDATSRRRCTTSVAANATWRNSSSSAMLLDDVGDDWPEDASKVDDGEADQAA